MTTKKQSIPSYGYYLIVGFLILILSTVIALKCESTCNKKHKLDNIAKQEEITRQNIHEKNFAERLERRVLAKMEQQKKQEKRIFNLRQESSVDTTDVEPYVEPYPEWKRERDGHIRYTAEEREILQGGLFRH